ncbi:MAG: hypothetical protein A3G08_02455 [Candidatus Magasanikbacteria bacterium RIFCSPLOWO2_12_FULL_47_9b]|nr:MAG: hypothetical protein A3I74_02275 [Candidatus Magasanikbacteria bacterium RIFCSPLOWO2_02_FULL_47_16]OGH79665.1 MAG: hypothetical protein A3C10_01125 [Candidatus Magasanikbacteria bacterium RIFCSPHIGHO2_02_FULL_48_18]OGH81825.1 MAG: hypothetical protein A3G08_02455 [Candidatus Magasanikbacteria bacterium RIFCSPLOWO2_12_FULL_47_9b]
MPQKKSVWIAGMRYSPTAKKFTITYGNTPLLDDGGIIGDGNALLKGEISFSPSLEIQDDGKIKICFGEDYNPHIARANIKMLKRSDPAGLALLSWSMNLGFMDVAEGQSSNSAYVGVTRVALEFDKGKSESKEPGRYEYILKIPKFASAARKLTVDFVWLKNKKTLVFPITLKQQPIKLTGGCVFYKTLLAEVASEARNYT